MKRAMLAAALAAMTWLGTNDAAEAGQSSQLRCSYIPWDADGVNNQLFVTYTGAGMIPANAVYRISSQHGVRLVRLKKAIWSGQTVAVGSPYWVAGQQRSFGCSALATWVELDTGITRRR